MPVYLEYVPCRYCLFLLVCCLKDAGGPRRIQMEFATTLVSGNLLCCSTDRRSAVRIPSPAIIFQSKTMETKPGYCQSGKHYWGLHDEGDRKCCCNPEYVRVQDMTRRGLESIGAIHVVYRQIYRGWLKRDPIKPNQGF